MTLTEEEKAKFRRELRRLIFRNFAMKRQLSNDEIQSLLSSLRKPLEEEVFVVVTVDNYVPLVTLVTLNRKRALEVAHTDWPHERIAESGEIYFNQEEDGNMEQAVSVQRVLMKLNR